jgi:hypothetical protein
LAKNDVVLLNKVLEAGRALAPTKLKDDDYFELFTAEPFGLFAEALRDTGRTLPGVYELVGTYRCVPESGGGLRAIKPADLADIAYTAPWKSAGAALPAAE